MRRPTDSDVITLKYGATSSPYSATNPHAGVDYRAPTGSNIYAPHSGKVTIAGSLGTCGIAVEIDGGRFKSRLCHNSSVKVALGNNVSEGQVVALSGATGAAIGAHCHWILWDNGVRVDGSKYVTNQGEEMITNEAQNNLVFLVGVSRHAGESEKGRYIGKTFEYALNDILKNSDRLKQDKILQSPLADAQKKLDIIKGIVQ